MSYFHISVKIHLGENILDTDPTNKIGQISFG